MEISHSFSQYSCGGGGGMVHISARSVMGMAYVCSSCQSVSYSRCDAVFDIAADRAMRSLSTKSGVVFVTTDMCLHSEVGGCRKPSSPTQPCSFLGMRKNMFYFTLRSCVCNCALSDSKQITQQGLLKTLKMGKEKKNTIFFFLSCIMENCLACPSNLSLKFAVLEQLSSDTPSQY